MGSAKRALPHRAFRGAWTLLLVGFAVTAAWSFLRGNGEESLPKYSTIPDFSLIERSGRRVTRADLLGKVWVANFIYTHCPDTCPLQTAEMARLQEDFRAEEDFRLVSITVDPERDTREVLREYASRYRADPKRWLFLTGPEKAIYDLALKGFRLSVADPDRIKRQGPTSRAVPFRGVLQDRTQTYLGHDESHPIPHALVNALLSIFGPASAWAHHPGSVKLFIHSSRFALVDRKADIRGYYHSDDPKALQRLRRDIRTLLGDQL